MGSFKRRKASFVIEGAWSCWLEGGNGSVEGMDESSDQAACRGLSSIGTVTAESIRSVTKIIRDLIISNLEIERPLRTLTAQFSNQGRCSITSLLQRLGLGFGDRRPGPGFQRR